jgi:hypothetical protein
MEQPSQAERRNVGPTESQAMNCAWACGCRWRRVKVVELNGSDSSAGPIVPPHHLSITTQADCQTSRGASANHSRDRWAKPNGYPSLTGAIAINRGITPRPERSIGYFSRMSRKKTNGFSRFTVIDMKSPPLAAGSEPTCDVSPHTSLRRAIRMPPAAALQYDWLSRFLLLWKSFRFVRCDLLGLGTTHGMTSFPKKLSYGLKKLILLLRQRSDDLKRYGPPFPNKRGCEAVRLRRGFVG